MRELRTQEPIHRSLTPNRPPLSCGRSTEPKAGGDGQLEPPGWKAADSFGDNNLVTFGIRNHALVVSAARPPWPIEKREPVVLQSFGKGVDGDPRAQLYTQVCIP